MFPGRDKGQLFTVKDTGAICLRHILYKKKIAIFHIESRKHTQWSIFSPIINLIMTSGFKNLFYSRVLPFNSHLFRFVGTNFAY